MTFEQFISSAHDTLWWQQYSSICFISSTYPLLFFSQLFDILCQQQVAPRVERLAAEDIDLASIEAALYQMFLGQRSWYWLGDTASCAPRKREQILNMCVTYTGPHRVMMFSHEKNHDLFKRPHKNCAVVHVPDKINKKQAQALMTWSGAHSSETHEQLKTIFTTQVTNSIDAVLRVMRYAPFVSRRMWPTFERSYLPHLLEQDTSLFSLSQYFFARRAQEFFTLWRRCSSVYPELFWVSFWGDQLWRAYYVTLFMSHKNIAEARRMAARLPFIFPKQLWHHYSVKELATLHERMYYIDHALKTGSRACHLDMFYAQHFGKQFTR